MFDRTAYHREYRKNKLKRVSLELPIEQYEIVKEHTKKTNETVNGFIKRAITETLKHDNAND